LKKNSNETIYTSGEKKRTKIPENEELKPFQKNLNVLLEGENLEKFGKWGTRNEKLVRISNNLLELEWRDVKRANKAPDSILIETIERIEVGNRSAYFQKKKLSEAEANLCFTIVCSERNLNLRAQDVRRREAFVEALQLILNEKTKLKKLAIILKKIKGKTFFEILSIQKNYPKYNFYIQYFSKIFLIIST